MNTSVENAVEAGAITEANKPSSAATAAVAKLSSAAATVLKTDIDAASTPEAMMASAASVSAMMQGSEVKTAVADVGEGGGGGSSSALATLTQLADASTMNAKVATAKRRCRSTCRRLRRRRAEPAAKENHSPSPCAEKEDNSGMMAGIVAAVAAAVVTFCISFCVSYMRYAGRTRQRPGEIPRVRHPRAAFTARRGIPGSAAPVGSAQPSVCSEQADLNPPHLFRRFNRRHRTLEPAALNNPFARSMMGAGVKGMGAGGGGRSSPA